MPTRRGQKIQRFGEKLRLLRTRRDMTLKELAAALGYTAHGHISELEAGKKMPTVVLVVAVARLFDVPTDELLKDELEVNRSEPKPKQKGT